MLAKIDVWFSNRKVQKAMAKISPRYLARSPVNIFSATKFIRAPYLDDVGHLCDTQRVHLRMIPFRTATNGMLSVFWRFFGTDDFAPLLHACQNPSPVSG